MKLLNITVMMTPKQYRYAKLVNKEARLLRSVDPDWSVVFANGREVYLHRTEFKIKGNIIEEDTYFD